MLGLWLKTWSRLNMLWRLFSKSWSCFFLRPNVLISVLYWSCIHDQVLVWSLSCVDRSWFWSLSCMHGQLLVLVSVLHTWSGLGMVSVLNTWSGLGLVSVLRTWSALGFVLGLAYMIRSWFWSRLGLWFCIHAGLDWAAGIPGDSRWAGGRQTNILLFIIYIKIRWKNCFARKWIQWSLEEFGVYEISVY